MKKFIAYIIVFAAAIYLGFYIKNHKASNNGDMAGYSTKITNNNSAKAPETGYKDIEIEEEKSKNSIDYYYSDSVISKAMANQQGKYCYEAMDSSLNRLYAEIYLTIKDHRENVILSTTDTDELQYAFQCVFNDHPEFYYIDGYSYQKNTKGDKVVSLSFSGKYTYSTSECITYQQQIDGYVSRFLGGINQSSSDYDKVKYTYDYIIKNTDYVIGSPDNQNILSVFLYGQSVCQGYAKAMQYLLNKLGVECTMVVGHVNTGEGHAWNLVKINNSYYYADPTWGDSSYTANSGMTNVSAVNYDYLNITTDEICKNHAFNNVVPLPQCISTEANYYVKEGYYLEACDSTAIRIMFDKAYRANKSVLSIKCKDANVYSEVYNSLIVNQEVFNYLDSNVANISYVSSGEELTFTFWL